MSSLVIRTTVHQHLYSRTWQALSKQVGFEMQSFSVSKQLLMQKMSFSREKKMYNFLKKLAVQTQSHNWAVGTGPPLLAPGQFSLQ